MKIAYVAVALASLAACNTGRSAIAPNPQPGSGHVATVVTPADTNAAPTDGGPFAPLCGGIATAPTCPARLIEVCSDPYDAKSCTKQLAEQVPVCVRQHDGPAITGYAWQCALKDWFTR